MEFSRGQSRFLDSKKAKFQVLKGELGTGKTTVSLYKGVDFENNYCIYNNDRVAFITSSKDKVKVASEIYKDAKSDMKNEFYSLFTLDNKSKFDIVTINDLVELYSKSYMREQKLSLKYSKKSLRINKLENVYNFFKKENKLSRFLEKVSLDYLLEEIEWIKSCAFVLSEYLEISRKGRKKSIRVNSVTREQIFSICQKYSFELQNSGYMDKYDEVLFAIEKANKMKKEYAHVILDDCENLIRAEFKFVESIKNNKYGMYVFILNKINSTREHIWLAKGRNISTVVSAKTKNFILKNKFNVKKNVVSTIENYQYKDIIHGKKFDFMIDNMEATAEVILYKDGVEESVKSKDLISVPVYSNIAAGNPIEMNELAKANMNIPRRFLRKENEVFMLSVKGDSMIDKGIDSGDFVVVKKQAAAYHNEIVAVDINGSATLKTLNLNAPKPLLMPANEKYEPIKLEGEEVNILGVVLGILKKQ
ncbi:MAG: LexA family protein [Sarcina sp.]